jgi:predicted RNA-binding protein with PUA-like domain
MCRQPAARILQLLAICAKDKAVLHPLSSLFSFSRNLHCTTMTDQCGFVSVGISPSTISTSSADSIEANNKTVQYFLLKSEPSEYSISDMERDTREEWGGIRNFQARNHLRSMNVGDRAFFYHSKSSTTGIVGTVKIVRTAQPDPSALDPKSEYFDAKSSLENRWVSVLIEYEQTFPVAITLKELKEEAANDPDGAIANMALFKQSRLSVVPLTFEQWEAVLGLVKTTKRRKKSQ